MTLDAVEALAAITGIGLVNGERKAAVTEDEIGRAGKLPEKIADLCKSAVNGSLETRVPPPINFRRALEELSRMRGHSDNVELLDKFPPGYRKLATGYGVFLSQLRAEVLKMVPRHVQSTITGPVVNPAPDYQAAKFLSVLQVIDDPIQVVRAIGAGTLTKKQGEAVKLVYPGFAELVTRTLVECVVVKRATSPSWMPSWRLNNGMAAWFGTSPIPQPMLQRLQDAHLRFAEQRAQQDAQNAPPGPPSNKSPADRAQFEAPR